MTISQIKNELKEKSIPFEEHGTHLNIKTEHGTLVYYRTGTTMLKGKRIPRYQFWKIVNKLNNKEEVWK